MGRVIGWVVAILVLYAIITQPVTAAATTTNLASGVASAGRQVVVFIQSVVGSTQYSQVHGVPSGGAATGDGTYP